MRKHRGFTLIEVVLALGIVMIVSTTLYQGQRNLLRRPQVDLPTVDWYLMLHELENPDHHFAVNRISQNGGLEPGRSLRVINTETKKQYQLEFENHRIYLHHLGGGDIYFMAGVRQFHIEPNLMLTMTTLRGAKFHARLLLPDLREQTNEKTSGDHPTVSH